MNDRPGEMDERDVDERFASIVAAWGPPPGTDEDPPAPEPEPEPETADADPTTPDPAGADTAAAEPEAPPAPAGGGDPGVVRAPWVNPSPLDGVVPASAWRAPDSADAGSTPPALEDEHYEPPRVDLPPQEDLHFWGAVLGLVAGPLCLVYVAMARPFHSTRWFLAGLALSLLGFALLVLRQPRDRDTDDDGARV